MDSAESVILSELVIASESESKTREEPASELLHPLGIGANSRAGYLQLQSHNTAPGELSQLHHYIGPENVPELQAVHRDAYPTAIFYVTTILSLYTVGLLFILVHYMNSSYGKWAWSLNDVWDELRPSFCWQKDKSSGEANLETAEDAANQRSIDLVCDDEEECHLHPNKSKRKRGQNSGNFNGMKQNEPNDQSIGANSSTRGGTTNNHSVVSSMMSCQNHDHHGYAVVKTKVEVVAHAQVNLDEKASNKKSKDDSASC